MKEDPQDIAAWLVQQHGLEHARVEVLASVMQAHEQEDNYALSVWRDVKRILGQPNYGGQRRPESTVAIPGAEVFAGRPNRAAGPRRAQCPAASGRPADGRPE